MLCPLLELDHTFLQTQLTISGSPVLFCDVNILPYVLHLVFWNINLTSVNGLNNVVRVLELDTAADRLGSTQDLLSDGGQSLTERLLSHLSGDLEDLVKRNVTTVLDVLVLLSVSRRLLQGSDDERRGRWNNGGGGLSVLDSQLDSDLDTLEVLGGLGNVFTNLLWGQTERTDLWGKGGGSTDFTTNGSQVQELHFRRVEFWRHGIDLKIWVRGNWIFFAKILALASAAPKARDTSLFPVNYGWVSLGLVGAPRAMCRYSSNGSRVRAGALIKLGVSSMGTKNREAV